MKKVAICISGLVRDFETSSVSLFDKLININKNYEFDIFLDAWSTRNSKNSEMFLRGDIDKRKCYDNFDSVNANSLYSVYNPVFLKIDNINKYDFSFTDKYNGMGNNPKAVFSQFFKVKSCADNMFSYINNSFTNYDCVVRTRFDLNMNKIDLKLFNIKRNTVFVETDGCPYNWTSDKFCITDLETYKIYSNFYDNLHNLIEKNKKTTPELLLYNFLTENNVEIIKTNLIGKLNLF